VSKTTFSKPPWYELIDPLKNLRSTLVPGTKELSLVILGITKLCLLYLFGCDEVVIYLNILFIQNVMNCDCFNMILLELCVCIHTYIHTYIYIYTYIYIHIISF